MNNTSVVTMFTLSGFDSITEHRFILFALTFVFYCVIVQVNVTLIVIIIIDKSLHEPMFIFICNLCINALYRTAGFYPKFLMDILSDSHVISYAGCFVQSLVVTSSTCVDFSFLVLMAYDRYVAICRPLVYHSVMNTQRVSVLVFAAWFVPVVQMLVIIISTSTIRLCSSKISRVYCVTYAKRRLECSVSITTVLFPAFMITFYLCLFLLVIYSYFHIMKTCLTSKDDRIKFLQTCLPHLMSFIVMSMCLLFDILHEGFSSERIPESARNFIAIQFLLVPPLINPLIYGLKLNKVRNRINRFMCRKS
uniref:Odorant receptor n=1 Tax=Tetraodon nigroviridis TaxID=99883 RepID=Q2PR44_TETNG|nr:odorant receptor [Tetraodon nigroviridis]